MRQIESEVVVVGAGPVGLVLAADLAWRGREVAIVETRHRGEPPSVKCNHVSARSMEILRRLGMASDVRAAGLPDDYPHDVSYRTTTTGMEIARIKIPGRDGRKNGETGPDSWWPTPEPPHRINQIYLEPILFEHVAAMPNVRIFNRMRGEQIDQAENHVLLTASDIDTREISEIRARYLVGCDGGRSFVRKSIGARLTGDEVIQRVQSTHIRAPQLLDRLQAPAAWAMYSLNPRRSGNVYAIDGRETWLVHNYLRPEETGFESVDRDRSIREILGVGSDFEYAIISREDWFGRRLVADKFQEDRVFICGDAAHIWVPYAGYGMNAGIADAADLAWQIASVLSGWGDCAIVNAYQAERLPITEQVSHFAMNHAHAMARQRVAIPAEIEAPGQEGEAVRSKIGKAAYELNVRQYCCGGLNFGYFYDRSPLIHYDGQTHPEYGMALFTSSTVPGCRLPHFVLPDGSSLYDNLGPDYTLLRLDRRIDVDPAFAAAREVGVPLKLLDLDPHSGPAVYRHGLVLVRPDQHVAWRGDALPRDPSKLVDRIRGVLPRQRPEGA